MSQGSQHFYTQQISTVIKELLLDKNTNAASDLYAETHDLKSDAKIAIQHLTADDILLLGNHFYQKQSTEILETLFFAAAQIFPDDQKHVFAQFLDSIQREKTEGKQHVS